MSHIVNCDDVSFSAQLFVFFGRLFADLLVLWFGKIFFMPILLTFFQTFPWLHKSSLSIRDLGIPTDSSF